MSMMFLEAPSRSLSEPVNRRSKGGNNMREPTEREIYVILAAVRAARDIIEEITHFPCSDVADKNGYLLELSCGLNEACIKLCDMCEEAT